MKLSVIGLGKLGLCTAACFARAGYEVTGVDINKKHVDLIRSGKQPFEENQLKNVLMESEKNLHVTIDLSTAINQSDISFIIVPTPSMKDGSFTNKYIHNVLERMVPSLKAKDSFHIINIVSTVMPGSCENEFVPLLEKKTGKIAGRDFGLAYNPEFIAIGSVIHNFLNPDLVLIGVTDEKTAKTLKHVYAKTCFNSPYMAVTSLINAEITKLSINCYCTMKISFANNLGSICEKVPGACASEITHIIGQDTRIGSKYIKPGLGFGGPCFPRDNEAFIKFVNDVGEYSGLQEAVITINNKKIEKTVEKIIRATELVGNKVALLGLSYKPDTYLTERSQSADIAFALADSGLIADLKAYDPMARMNGKWHLADSVRECVTDMNVAAVLTPWPEFFNEDWQQFMAKDRVVLNFWE